jgi:hypothetical protein
MRYQFVLAVFCLLLVGVIPSQAQFTQDPNDLGAADSVDMVFTVTPCASTNQLQIQLDLYVFNDSNTISGVSMGFSWDNPNLQMDSARPSQLTQDAFDLGTFFYEDDDINLTNANRRFLFGGARLFSAGLQGAPTRQLWASYYFTLSGWNVNDSIVIDSLSFNAGSVWLFVVDEGGDYVPYWLGPKVQHDCDWTQPSNLIVAPDSLFFSAIQGGSNPPTQSFLVDSDGDPLDFNIVENIGWAIPSPVQGTTPQNVNVLINITALPVGTYVDSFSVEAAGAANSPQYVKLVLVVEPPPPTIGVDPSQFFFNAIAGDTNPSPKTLTITNIGGSTLNWTVSNSQPWLSLSPTSGVDSGDVTVAVDITGLPFGEYYDTIVVSDPNATNDPVPVPVTLNVASELPVIDVDSSFNFIIVPSGVSSVPPREIVIKNVAGGILNFWLEESSPRILSMNPYSGTAPQTVEVTFKIIGGQAGDDFFDTLWVYSNEAINSPFPVVFQFHYVDNPGQLFVNADTVQFNVFECDMGADVGMPQATVFVSNIGGDDPLSVKLIYESDLFTVDVDSGVAPFAFTVTASDLQLPLGTYYDTILIAAQKAINSPETLIVQFNMIAGLTQPEIFLYKDSYVIPAQENAGPTIPVVLKILNKFGGCMSWEIQEDVPWLTPVPDSGEVPGSVELIADATGYVMGEYVDSFFVIAPSATNSPRKVSLLFRVWRFHGDLNYNGMVNIADLTYMVDYLFRYGPMPEPELIVGDLNCDHAVNIADLTYFVEYLFNNGPIPCGNPYFGK